MSSVKLIAVTKGVGDLENLSVGELLAYVARVSNPDNQMNHETSPKLLAYCRREGHWSVFETCSVTVEVVTSLAIATQILRHCSMKFQQHSLRYSEAVDFEVYEARRQDTKNRQNSIDDLDVRIKEEFEFMQKKNNEQCFNAYKHALSLGIAKEQARFLLPASTKTTMYVTGNIRSWITYCMVRCAEGVQREHRDIAEECKRVILELAPELKECF